MDLLDLIVHFVKQNKGTKKGRIGVELGHSPRQHGVSLCDGIRIFEKALPDATFVNRGQRCGSGLLHQGTGEIKLLRQAAAIADSGIKCVRDAWTSA